MGGGSARGEVNGGGIVRSQDEVARQGQACPKFFIKHIDNGLSVRHRSNLAEVLSDEVNRVKEGLGIFHKGIGKQPAGRRVGEVLKIKAPYTRRIITTVGVVGVYREEGGVVCAYRRGDTVQRGSQGM